jgi:hypothetical protein
MKKERIVDWKDYKCECERTRKILRDTEINLCKLKRDLKLLKNDWNVRNKLKYMHL